MSSDHRRSRRRPIDLADLESDPSSFLSWGIEDAALRKLEAYRLYRAGYAVADIALALGFSRGYLYELWSKFTVEGIEALVDKRWGSPSRKRTTEKEAAVLRAKALDPGRGDSDLAQEFGMDRSTIYLLLQEHGLQDLHRVISGEAVGEEAHPAQGAVIDEGEKKGLKSSRVNRRSF